MVFIMAIAAAVIVMVAMGSSKRMVRHGGWHRRLRALQTHLNGDAEAPRIIREFFDRHAAALR